MACEDWRLLRVAEMMSDRKDWVTIEDHSQYRRISARVRNQGIEQRDIVFGREIRTKRQQLVRAGDLIVAEIDAKVGGIGVVPVHLGGSIVSSHYFVLEPNLAVVLPEWLDQVARSGELHRQVVAVGSTNYAAIRRAQVHEFSLRVPPVSHQRKIASILSSADDAIDKTEAVIEQLGVVKKALMRELLTNGRPGKHARFIQTGIGMVPEGWEITTVGALGDFSGGYGFRPPDWSKSGLPIIRIQNLNGSKDFNHFSGNPDPGWLVEPGELLFAWAGSRGASFGPCIWPGPRGVLNQHIHRINPRPTTRKRFLYYLLRIITEQVEKKAHGFKDTLVHLRKGELTGWPVALPPLDEQDEIVRSLDAIEGRIHAENQALEGMRCAKAELMSSLLSGEVQVTPDKDEP